MKCGGLEFAGLDIETTGSTLATAGLCQIGVYLGPGKHYVSDVRPRVGSKVEAQALKVNGFTHERLERGADPLDVSAALERFLLHEGLVARRLIAVGWNVAGFDLPFVHRDLSPMAWLLSYRTVDLNAVCFTLSPTSWRDIKREAKEYAAARVKVEEIGGGWHDALFDAATALHAWEYLRVKVNGG